MVPDLTCHLERTPRISLSCQVEGEEEGDGAPEGTEIDFALVFYNLAGEEVQQVNGGSAEAEGVKVGREFEPDPEPEPEQEKEPAEGEEGAEPAEGEVRRIRIGS